MRHPLRKTKYTRRQHPFPTFPPLLKRGTPRAGSPMLLLTKETVKKHRHSAHEFWAQHRLVTSWWIPTWDVEGCGPKICKFIFVSRDTIPHPAWLAARFTHLHEPPTFFFFFFSLSLPPVITIRDHKWNLSPLFPRNNGTITVRHKRGGHAACAILYVDIHMHLLPGAKFSSIPIHVPRYILPREERRGEKFTGNGPATGYRFILYPVPGRFVLRSGHVKCPFV